jgi:nucleotide-binding universal stress UspA family protein
MAMNRRATVVVGVDGSAGSRPALRFALEDAARRGAVLRAVRVFPPVEFWVREWDVSPERMNAEIQADLQEQTRKMIDEVAGQRNALAAVPAEVRVLSGRTAPVLLEQSSGADLLVVGNRGHGEAVSVLLGSVGLKSSCTPRAPSPSSAGPPGSGRPSGRPPWPTGPPTPPRHRCTDAAAALDAVRLARQAACIPPATSSHRSPAGAPTSVSQRPRGAPGGPR